MSAYRALFYKVCQSNQALRPFLNKESQMQQILKYQSKMNLATMGATKPKVSLIKKYAEIVPLIVIVGGGIIGLSFYIIRNAITRDDVRYLKGGKMQYQAFDKENPEKHRKFITFNQKYETPKGLAEALAALEEDAPVVAEKH